MRLGLKGLWRIQPTARFLQRSTPQRLNAQRFNASTLQRFNDAMRLALLTIAAVVTLCALPREALAWSRDGHRIVCRIAWQLLDETRRAEVERLTSTYRDGSGWPSSSR